MGNDDAGPPATTPKKNHLSKPLHRADFVTPISGTVSSVVSSENRLVTPGLFYDHYEVADLQCFTEIPVDAFLIGMGVLHTSLQINDDSISMIASNARIDQLCTTYGTTSTEVERYGPFCELTNFVVDMCYTRRAVFTRNDPYILGSPYTFGGLKPDVVTLSADCVDVSDGKWRKYCASGPSLEMGITWAWSDVLQIIEFKKQKDSFCPAQDYVSRNLTVWEESPSARLDTRKVKLGRPRAKRSNPSSASAHASSTSSKRRRKSTYEDTAVVRGSCSSSTKQTKDASKGRSARNSSGKNTPALPVPQPTPESGPSAPGTAPTTLTLFAPPRSDNLSLDQKKAALEQMKKEDEEPFRPEEVAEANEELQKNTLRRDLEVGGIKYAIDMMSTVLSRRHVFALLIMDGIVRLAYYDRAGPVYSGPLYFLADLYRFVLLLQRMVEMDRSEIGFLDCLSCVQAPTATILEAIEPYTEWDHGMYVAASNLKSGRQPYALKLHDSAVAYLIVEIGGRRAYGLISRGTAVFLGYLVSPNETGLFAIKLSWPHAWRRSEVDILEEARAALREVDADPEFQKVYGVRKLEESLPSVITTGDLDDLKKEQSFRWRTQEFYENFHESNRILRGIVFEHLFPLHGVITLDHFKTAVRDIVLAHHFLWTSKRRILHRDISLRNLMVRYYPGTDRIKGVLIDFDLATIGPPTTEGHFGRRTGTRPYMARELLSIPTPVHLERFDWESFFYVICWIAAHYSYGVKVESNAFNEWDEQDDNKLREIKANLLFGNNERDLIDVFTVCYKPLITTWMDDMQAMFLASSKARKRFIRVQATDETLTFDEETCNGEVTWEKLWAILVK